MVLITGEMILKNGPLKKKRTKNMRTKPSLSNLASSMAISSGTMPIRTLNPSRGGRGKRLNMASATFQRRPVKKISAKMFWVVRSPTNIGVSLNRIAKKTAIRRFVIGPDRATIAMSFFGSRRLYGSTGIGLAAPKMIPDPDIVRRRGRAIVIMGSMWGIGFKVNRPLALAVGSPNLSAIKPCAIS